MKKIINEEGKTTGIFIPIEEWEFMKGSYPDFENLEVELPHWQREILDQRIEEADNHPDELLPIEKLVEFLNRDK